MNKEAQLSPSNFFVCLCPQGRYRIGNYPLGNFLYGKKAPACLRRGCCGGQAIIEYLLLFLIVLLTMSVFMTTLQEGLGKVIVWIAAKMDALVPR